MSGFLLLIGFIAAILFVFARVLRGRVQRRMEQVEMPPELMAALRAKAATGQAGRPALAGAGAAPSIPGPAVPAAGPRPPHFMLIYEVAPDYLQRRAQFRDEHLALAWKAADAGELVMGGALDEPMDQALLLFKGSREAALRFAAADPYVRNGLVKSFKVRQWHTVAGAGAANPLRPKL
jgi:uncharacterized protein YciI